MRAKTYIIEVAAAITLVAAAVSNIAAQTPAPVRDSVRKPAAASDTASAAPAKSDTAGAYAAGSLPSRGPNTFLLAGETGSRMFLYQPPLRASAKFEEYKNVTRGGVLLNALASYTMGDSITVFQLNGINFGQRDQAVRFRGNSPGLYDLQVRWDRIPHTFSTNARSLGRQPSPDVFVLPNPRPDTSLWNAGSPFLPPVRMLWNAVRSQAAFTPTPAWDLRAEYTSIGKMGSRPMGMAFGSPGSNLREILEPIDQTMTDVKLTESYARTRFQMSAMYDLSYFRNKYTSVTSDNPALAVDAATTGSSRGRTALAPTNHAHTGVINTSFELPWRTRLNANGSYSLWVQDEPFIPATINSAITDPRIAQIPKSLGGHSGTSSVYISLVSHPVTPLTLSAKFRTFSFRDHVDADTIPVLVVNDRSLSAGVEREGLPFTRKNSDVAGTWRFTALPAALPVTLSTGFAWETWKRSEARNVADLREGAPRVSLDVGVLEWMSLRTSYTTGRRRIHGEYIQNTPGDQPLHRRFDQADRDRERTNFLATITPMDELTVSGSWTVGHDEYPNSLYGLQSDRSNMEEGDLAWSPTSRLSLDGSYSKERFLTRLTSQYRAPGQLNNPTYNWVANNYDEVKTMSAGFHATLIPDVLEGGGRTEFSNAKFRMATYNPLTPAGGTAAQNFAATAGDLPLITQKFRPTSVFLSYRVRPGAIRWRRGCRTISARSACCRRKEMESSSATISTTTRRATSPSR